MKYRSISLGPLAHARMIFQLMDSLGNANHDISVVASCIFDSNYKRALVLNSESLDIISPRLLLKNRLISLKKYLLQ